MNGHNKKINFNNEKNKLKSLFTNVIKTRLRSDFPSACLLSGGIDSSSIVSIANQKLKKKIDCFSLLSKDKNYDESYYINKTIKKEKDSTGWCLDKPDKSSIFSKYLSSLLSIKIHAKNARFINR